MTKKTTKKPRKTCPFSYQRGNGNLYCSHIWICKESYKGKNKKCISPGNISKCIYYAEWLAKSKKASQKPLKSKLKVSEGKGEKK